MNFIKNNKLKLLSALVIIVAIAVVIMLSLGKSFDNNNQSDEKIQLENGAVIDTDTDKMYCSLTIRCDAILTNMDLMDKEKIDIVPKDGIILKEDKIEFEKGESVFDVVVRVAKDKKIHIDFDKAAGNVAAYVRGIGNIYEFDCGDMSGWIYTVNGKSPDVSYDNYVLQNGDNVEWVYICSFDESMQ